MAAITSVLPKSSFVSGSSSCSTVNHLHCTIAVTVLKMVKWGGGRTGLEKQLEMNKNSALVETGVCDVVGMVGDSAATSRVADRAAVTDGTLAVL